MAKMIVNNSVVKLQRILQTQNLKTGFAAISNHGMMDHSTVTCTRARIKSCSQRIQTLVMNSRASLGNIRKIQKKVLPNCRLLPSQSVLYL